MRLTSVIERTPDFLEYHQSKMVLENVSEYIESTQKDLELLMLNSFLIRTMDVFLVRLATSLYQTIRLTVAETET